MCAMVVAAGSLSLIAVLVEQRTDKRFYEKAPTAIGWALWALLVISLAYGFSSFICSFLYRKSHRTFFINSERNSFRGC